MEKTNPRHFRQLLKERGLKATRQRDVIVQVFMESDPHVSVEELTRRVRRKDPHIGCATVYRTLKLMAESGLASSRQFGDGLARFERRSEGQHHDHMICTLCGRIVEFESEPIEALQSRVAREEGFRIFDHKLELYGLCPACAPQGGALHRGGKVKGRGGSG